MKKLSKRLLAQIGFFILQNPFLHNFYRGKIYSGELKNICTPGLNCYSCPAAATACPIGIIQSFLSDSKQNISLFVTGFLLTTGVIFGRFICGFVCPMGLIQDLLYRIKTPKAVLKLKFLRYAKYVVLALFVIALPLLVSHELSGLGDPWFCKYICPSGTILGAIPLMLKNDFLRESAGLLFMLKLSIAAAIIIAAIFIYRFFCRTLCPLGAFYSLLNKIAILHMKCDKEKCVSCGNCEKACQLKINPAEQPNSPECIRCGKCAKVCGPKALSCTTKR